LDVVLRKSLQVPLQWRAIAPSNARNPVPLLAFAGSRNNFWGMMDSWMAGVAQHDAR
jgi:hypothetical protein